MLVFLAIRKFKIKYTKNFSSKSLKEATNYIWLFPSKIIARISSFGKRERKSYCCEDWMRSYVTSTRGHSTYSFGNACNVNKCVKMKGCSWLIFKTNYDIICFNNLASLPNKKKTILPATPPMLPMANLQECYVTLH